MKKFKKSIEISTENISDVLQVPIVTSLYKTKNLKTLVLKVVAFLMILYSDLCSYRRF
mgnify:CR=1 FL=1